jgi:hypothetical protein
MLLMKLNKFTPILSKIEPLGMPPSSLDPIGIKQGDNNFIIISGERNFRSIKIFRIK